MTSDKVSHPPPSMDVAGLDAWALLGLPGGIAAANYLTSANAKQYRLIIDVLADELDQSLTGVAHDELVSQVRHRLPVATAEQLMEELNIDSRLRQLVLWGTCHEWQDRADTEAEFLRNRSRYQLSETAALLHTAVREMESQQGAGSSAVLMAAATLAERIRATLTGIASGDLTTASTAYSQVQTTLEAMARAASDWQARLATALGGTPDEEKVHRMLETILAYVEAWGAGIDANSDTIRAQLPELRGLETETWRGLALARVQASAPHHTVQEAISELKASVVTLSAWFDGPAAQAARLRRQMRDAVAPVLRSHRTLLAVGGTVSRRAELLRLARAIDDAPSDREAERIWGAATGLYRAAHLRLDSPAIVQPVRTSIWDAPPAEVSRRLRAQGGRSVAGGAGRMIDTSGQRARARQEAARRRARLADAETALIARSGTVLSSWSPLGTDESTIFLALLTTARAAPPHEGACTGTSQDGRLTLILRSLPGMGTAVVATPDGRLAVQDAAVVIRR
ncbi:MAG: DUF2397 domain-containing protein [Arachnia sp.]